MTLRDSLAEGRPLLGAWKGLPDPVGAELTGRAGFDWVCIDTQHGLIGYEAMVALLQAVAVSGTPVIVRVPSNDGAAIGRALDAGAQGVIVPYVETADEARRAVAACRYPPLGVRSWGPVRPLFETGTYSPEQGNRDVVCLVMIETVRGLANADDILAVEGVDGVYVGPNDLALSAGLPPSLSFDTPEHRELVDRVVAAARAQDVVLGTHPATVDRVAEYVAMGFRLLGIHVDVRELRATTGAALATARSQLSAVPGRA